MGIWFQNSFEWQVCYDILKIASDAIPDSVKGLKQHFISLLQFSAE